MFERAKTVHALDRAATVIGIEITALYYSRIKLNKFDKKKTTGFSLKEKGNCGLTLLKLFNLLEPTFFFLLIFFKPFITHVILPFPV
jgi:hypothetical protein